MPDSHITSLIIRVANDQFNALCSWLSQAADIEIVGVDQSRGKIVIVIDVPSSRHIQNYLGNIKDFSGVMSAEMVYHHVEDFADHEESTQ